MTGAGEDPMIGGRVGSYRITGMLGQGGMGRVYAAVHPEVGSRVAIKVMNEEYARDRDLAERFFAEARAVNYIRHENIVNVLDLVTLPDGRPVIIMELIEGKTLRELVRLGATPLGGVVHVMIDVLAALAAAHAAGVIHRDLKPDNIIVTASGRAKVLDFGIAKLARPTPGSAPRTRTGAVLGTPEYMAPEQISGGQIDARTDVYAAGVVLFEALTGRRPFDGASDFEVMRQHVDQPPPPARSLRATIPVELEGVLTAALAKRPGERFANATAMAAALHAASAVLPASEWRAFVPEGRGFVRPAAPPQPPAPHASLIGFVPERSGSLPTVHETPRARRRVDTTPTVHEAPSARGRAGVARRPAWVVPILAATGVATLAVVIAVAVTRRGSRAPTPLAAASTVPVVAVVPDAAVGASATAEPPRADDDRRPRSFFDAAVLVGDAYLIESKHAGTAADPIRVRVNFDPTRFDPVATYPRVLKAVRAVVPGAALVSIEVGPVDPGAFVDITRAGQRNRYVFRAASGADVGFIPAGTAGRHCYVDAIATPTGFEVSSSPSADCARPLVPAPSCPFAQVLTQVSLDASVMTYQLDRGNSVWSIGDERFVDRCGKPGVPPPKPVSASRSPLEVAARAPVRELTPGDFSLTLDRGSFDPLEYVATARELARRLAPDAELTDITLMPVRGPGTFVLGIGNPNSADYEFRSPSHSHDVDVSVGARCLVEVTVLASGYVGVATRSSDLCREAPVRAPRCTLPQVWSKALAKGMTWTVESPDVSVSWTARGWLVRGLIGPTRETFVLPDDCR